MSRPGAVPTSDQPVPPSEAEAEALLVEAVRKEAQGYSGALSATSAGQLAVALPAATGRAASVVESVRSHAEAALPAPAKLVSDLLGADLKALTGPGGILKAFPKAMTKQVYQCTQHALVLAVAANSAAERALRAEVGTLKQYHDLGMRSAMHAPVAGQESPIFTVVVDDKPCVAALQPFCTGLMAQLSPKNPPDATELINKTLDDWKKAFRGGAGPLSWVDYARRLKNFHTDLAKVVGHFTSDTQPTMYDLQFFIDQDNGQVTLFDPGSPSDSQEPTSGQKTVVKKWLQTATSDLDGLKRAHKRLDVKDEEVSALLS